MGLDPTSDLTVRPATVCTRVGLHGIRQIIGGVWHLVIQIILQFTQ